MHWISAIQSLLFPARINSDRCKKKPQWTFTLWSLSPIQSNPQQLHNTLLYFVGLQREREGKTPGSVHFMANGGVRNEERSWRARSKEGRGIEGDRLHWEAPGFHIGSSPLHEPNHIDWLNFSQEWDQCWCEFLAGCIHYSLSAVAKRRKRHKGSSNGSGAREEWSGVARNMAIV